MLQNSVNVVAEICLGGGESFRMSMGPFPMSITGVTMSSFLTTWPIRVRPLIVTDDLA